MAVSISFGTSFAGQKLDSLSQKLSLPSCKSGLALLRNRDSFGGKYSNELRFLNPRCEIGSESTLQREKNEPNSSSVTALELLKKSALNRYTKERSSIIALGLSIHTAPVEMREKLSIPEAEWPHAIEDLCNLNHIEEAAVLSTCNRMEIYAVALSWHRGLLEVIGWMAKVSGIPVSDLRKHLFILQDDDAVKHLFEVSSGLDSLVLGEGQILAQVKQAVKIGQSVSGFGRIISGLFKNAITVGKRVRTETKIASGSVSISSSAVELALMKLPKEKSLSARTLVIGAGKMGRLVIKHLASKGYNSIVVVNRSKESVISIQNELKNVKIIYRPFKDLLACASEADVIFTCTASETPLFLKEQVELLTPANSDIAAGGRLFIDISVPRNVGPCVYDLDKTRVYNVDDLKEVVEANKEERYRKSMEAQAIIEEESKKFVGWRDSLETVPTIKKLRSYAERIRLSEMEKYLSKMDDSICKKTRKDVDDLSRSIVNKLLHGPMQHLRCDEDRDLGVTLENMNALNRVFGLNTEVSLLEEKIREKVEQNKK